MASGDTLWVCFPATGEAPSTNFGTPDEQDGASVLDYDDTVVEKTEFPIYIPSWYDAGGINCEILWHSSVIVDNAKFDIQFKRLLNNPFSRAFDTLQTTGSVVVHGTTLSNSLDIAPFANDEIDGLLKNEFGRILFSFDRTVASVIADDAVLAGIALREA